MLRRHSTARLPQFGTFSLPQVRNEPMYDYEPGSIHRKKLQEAIKEMRSALKTRGPFEVPVVVGSKNLLDGSLKAQSSPTDHSQKLCNFRHASKETISEAIKSALAVKPMWERMP